MDPQECYWLYVVTQCKRSEGPRVVHVDDPARFSWHEVRKVEHSQLLVRALKPASSGGARE